MRNLFITAFLVITMSNIVLAETQKYNPNRPEWNEFCPFGMENAVIDTKFHLPMSQKGLTAKEQNYWVERKQDFEQNLSFCDSVEKASQDACYQKLRNRQYQINATYDSPQEKAAQQQAQFMQFSNIFSQQSLQQQQLNIQRQNMLLQNAPKWNADAYAPKTYNVNLNHKIRYNSGL